MAAHHLNLLVGEGTGLEQDGVRDPDLADVVDGGAEGDVVEPRALDAHQFRQRPGGGRDAGGVGLGIGILGLDRQP